MSKSKMSLHSVVRLARVKCMRSPCCCLPGRYSASLDLNYVHKFAYARLQGSRTIPKIAPLSRCLSIDSAPPQNIEKKDEKPPEKVGIVQRFKQMYRDYWYVLLPVHLVTSAVWMGSFYYIVKSGVDIVGLMESMGVSEKITSSLKDSKAGYFALTYACYKVATPLRYMVTIGGTTVSIKKLTELGWIKPMPSKERIKEIYQEKKEGLQDAFEEKKLELQQKTDQIKEKHSQVMDDIRRYRQSIRNMKDQDAKK